MVLVLCISLSVSLFPAQFTLSRPSFFQILLFPFPHSLFCCFFCSFTLSFPLPSSLPSLFSYQILVAFSSSASAHRIAERVRDDTVVAAVATVNCRNRKQVSLSSCPSLLTCPELGCAILQFDQFHEPCVRDFSCP